MNNNHSPEETVIDLKDIFWKFLMQWKAILVVCLLMSLLVPCVMYFREKSAYDAARADKAAAEEASSKTSEERIEAALAPLSESDRKAVLTAAEQQDYLDEQQTYINESILLNENPANQRTLTVYYLISSDSGADMKALIDAYDAVLRDDGFMGSLRDEIAPGKELGYIYELVNNKYIALEPDYTDAGSALFPVKIVLPEDSDADAVTALVNATVKDLHSSLDSHVGKHSIRSYRTEDTHVYNHYAVERKTGLMNSVYSVSNALKNSKSALSQEQKVALDLVLQERLGAEEQAGGNAEPEIQAPRFSKKYALFGFILGAFLYAVIWCALIIHRKEVSSAASAQRYTGVRLLGELYNIRNRSGLSALFASKAVARWCYRDKLATDKQLRALTSAIEAVCAHRDTDRLTLLLSGVDSRFNDLIKRIAEGSSVSIDLVDTDKADESLMASAVHAAYVLSSRTKVEKLRSMMIVANGYEISPLGTIFLEEL